MRPKIQETWKLVYRNGKKTQYWILSLRKLISSYTFKVQFSPEPIRFFI